VKVSDATPGALLTRRLAKQQACRDVPVGAPALPQGGPQLSNGPTVANQQQRTAVAGPHDNCPPRRSRNPVRSAPEAGAIEWNDAL